jgi:hypothetical protein
MQIHDRKRSSFGGLQEPVASGPAPGQEKHMKTQSKTLLVYAFLLLIPGLASVLYDPVQGAVALYLKGKTGLIVCGVAALLAVVMARLVVAGVPWARWGGLILSFLLLAQSGPKAFSIAKAVSAGTKDGHFWYQAALFAVIAAISLWATVSQFVSMRLGGTRPQA